MARSTPVGFAVKYDGSIPCHIANDLDKIIAEAHP